MIEKTFTKILVLSTLISSAKKASAQNNTINNPIGPNSLNELIVAVLEFIVRLGAIVVVFFVIYSGFLFVKAQGDPGKLSEAKSTFTYTIIGGVILLGAQVIAEVIKNTARQLGVV